MPLRLCVLARDNYSMSKNLFKRSLAEQASFLISLFIVSLIVVLICYAWITGDTNPPILSVTTDKIRQVEQQYYIPFTVTNSGGKTAHFVEVIAQIKIGQEQIAIGRQQVDFLSREETQSGEFIFDRDPQQGELTVRVASYQQP